MSYKTKPDPFGRCFKLIAKIDGTTIIFKADTFFDSSKTTPGNVSGGIEATSKIEAGAALSLVGDIIEVRVTGTTNLNATASLVLTGGGEVGSSIDLTGMISNSDVIGNYELQARVLGRPFTFYKGKHTFENTSNTEPLDVNLHEF